MLSAEKKGFKMIIENQKIGFDFWVSSKKKGQRDPLSRLFVLGTLRVDVKVLLGLAGCIAGAVRRTTDLKD
jgi:hypothetical protein